MGDASWERGRERRWIGAVATVAAVRGAAVACGARAVPAAQAQARVAWLDGAVCRRHSCSQRGGGNKGSGKARRWLRRRIHLSVQAAAQRGGLCTGATTGGTCTVAAPCQGTEHPSPLQQSVRAGHRPTSEGDRAFA